MTQYTDDALARAIYTLADERMQAEGKTLPYSMGVFSVMTAAAPDRVSYPAMAELRNADFLDAAFLLLLQRPIDDGAKEAWEKRLTLPETEFRTAVLNSILGSPEYQRNMIPLVGCTLPIQTQQPEVKVCVVNQGMPPRLVRIYQKLPKWMQKLAKKLAGKEEG